MATLSSSLHTAGHRLPLGSQALRPAARQPHQQLGGEVPRARAEQRRRAPGAAQLDLVPQAAPRVGRRLLPPAAGRGGPSGGAQGLPRAVQHRPGLLQPLRGPPRHGHALRVHAQRADVHDGGPKQGRVQGAGGDQQSAQGRRRAAPQDLAARQQQRGVLPDGHAG